MALFMFKKRFFILILCILLTSGCGANKSDNYIRVHDPTTIRNFDGEVLQEVVALESGFLFTIREHPLVYPGAPLARIAKKY